MRRNYSEWTRYTVYRIVKGVFGLAVRRGLLTRSPVDGLSGAEIPSQRNAKRSAVLSSRGARPARPGGGDSSLAGVPRLRRLRRAPAGRGPRLCWEDVNVEEGVLHVRFSMPDGTVKATKTSAGIRDVTLLPRLRRLLREWQLASPNVRPDDLVFGTRRGGSRSIRGTSAAPWRRRRPPPGSTASKTGSPCMRSTFPQPCRDDDGDAGHDPRPHRRACEPGRDDAPLRSDRRDQGRVNEDVLARAAAAGFGA
jgi:hypothetical protein